MEIFTFIQMGAKSEDIELEAIGGDGTTVESIIDNFKNFKGEEAQCFMPADRERLLAVVESAFGDFQYFNKIVRREFAAANERLQERASKASRRLSRRLSRVLSSSTKAASSTKDVVVTIA